MKDFEFIAVQLQFKIEVAERKIEGLYIRDETCIQFVLGFQFRLAVGLLFPHH